jgi:hypothetical protein
MVVTDGEIELPWKPREIAQYSQPLFKRPSLAVP